METAQHPEVVNFTEQAGITVHHRAATIIAPTLAVTALENVVKSISYGSGATANSAGAVCATVGATADTSSFQLLLNDGNQTPIGVKAIITSGDTDTCVSDYAFLVLDTPVTGITFPQIVLDAPPAVNSPITGCGWGPMDNTCSNPQAYPGCASGTVLISNGGYYAPALASFKPGFAVTSVQACTNGDYGGGFYDANGALLGVVQLGFNPVKVQNPPDKLCTYCVNDVSAFNLISTQTALVARAFAAVGSSPWRAGHPKPADVGGECTDALDCNTQLCVGVGSKSYCSQDCSTTACPSGTVCTTVDTRSVCLPQVTPHPASCAVGPDERTSNGSVPALMFVGLAGLVARFRRKKMSSDESNGVRG